MGLADQRFASVPVDPPYGPSARSWLRPKLPSRRGRREKPKRPPTAARSDSSAQQQRFQAEEYKDEGESLGLDAADQPFAGQVAVLDQRRDQGGRDRRKPAPGAMAKLSRRHAQASRPQVSTRPDHAKAAGPSHRDSQPKVK